MGSFNSNPNSILLGRCYTTAVASTSTPAPPPLPPTSPLTAEDCLQFYKRVYDAVDSYLFKSKLQWLKLQTQTITEKWNTLGMLLLMARIQAVKEMNGMEGNPAMLKVQEYANRLLQEKNEKRGNEIIEMEKKTLDMMLLTVFEKAPQPVTLFEARRLSFALCEAIFDDDFLQHLQLDTKGLENEMKNQVIIQKIHTLQTNVFQKEGYGGDDAFLKVQRGLMEYSVDRFVQYQTVSYNLLLIEAAQIQLNPNMMM
jgi:hypothetical protein